MQQPLGSGSSNAQGRKQSRDLGCRETSSPTPSISLPIHRLVSSPISTSPSLPYRYHISLLLLFSLPLSPLLVNYRVSSNTTHQLVYDRPFFQPAEVKDNSTPPHTARRQSTHCGRRPRSAAAPNTSSACPNLSLPSTRAIEEEQQEQVEEGNRKKTKNSRRRSVGNARNQTASRLLQVMSPWSIC